MQHKIYLPESFFPFPHSQLGLCLANPRKPWSSPSLKRVPVSFRGLLFIFHIRINTCITKTADTTTLQLVYRFQMCSALLSSNTGTYQSALAHAHTHTHQIDCNAATLLLFCFGKQANQRAAILQCCERILELATAAHSHTPTNPPKLGAAPPRYRDGPEQWRACDASDAIAFHSFRTLCIPRVYVTFKMPHRNSRAYTHTHIHIYVICRCVCVRNSSPAPAAEKMRARATAIGDDDGGGCGREFGRSAARISGACIFNSQQPNRIADII